MAFVWENVESITFPVILWLTINRVVRARITIRITVIETISLFIVYLVKWVINNFIKSKILPKFGIFVV